MARAHVILCLAVLLGFGCSTSHNYGPDLQVPEMRLSTVPIQGSVSSGALPTKSQIRKVMNAHRSEFPRCAVCDVKGNIVNGHQNDVHHIIPQSVNPLLAAAPDNLITACRNCHYVVFHHMNWTNYNKEALESMLILRSAYVRVQQTERKQDEK